MPFSTGIGLERVGVVGPELELLLGWSTGSRHWTPLQKQKQIGSAGARPLPFRCLSQFFLDESKDQLLIGRMFCVPFTDGVAWYLWHMLFPIGWW